MKMSENYEVEQNTLEQRLIEPQSIIATEQERTVNIESFLTVVRRYTDVQELTAEIIREFVERVEVYKAEKIGSRRIQRIKIVWNCIGEFVPPITE